MTIAVSFLLLLYYLSIAEPMQLATQAAVDCDCEGAD